MKMQQWLKTTMRFFVFLIFIVWTGKSAHSCKIEFHPPLVFVKFGGSTIANCDASLCSNVEGIGWESPFGGTGLVEGLSTLNVNLQNVKEWNTKPQCYIVLSDDTQMSENLPITVYKMPKKVSMPKPISPMKATGPGYVLQCDVEDVAPANRLIITLYKGNETIYEQNPKGEDLLPVNKSLQTTVNVVAEDHGKEVWCEARLNFSPAEQSPPPMRSESHVLTVYYPPTFTEPKNETLEISFGKTISLNCSATGNPTPVYSWHFADPTQEGIQKQNVTGPILTEDFRVSGVYSCTASNAAGGTTKYFNINKPSRNWTTIAIILAVFLTLGAVLFIGGAIFVTKNGTFSFQRGIYRLTSTGPI
ncbi:vascular cell adhesion protein 1-like [Girardinichthys multiradiatus]|uniref:vascular cell adhesion protein 1-like n=1 Tax=Girardinichthys multiradiatus TaxID=208333 RepID=UPI001FABC437|nr:vascular cell adhesion protein 1-like [Girardinichthys multiradiatus]